MSRMNYEADLEIIEPGLLRLAEDIGAILGEGSDVNDIYDWLESGELDGSETPESLAAEWLETEES